MKGSLYVVGVGPGDPELLTLKALRILKDVPVICVPKGREEGSSVALAVVNKMLNLENKEIIEAHFPMRKTRKSRQGQMTQSGDNQKIQEGETTDSRAVPHFSPEHALDIELDTKWNETSKRIASRLNKGRDVAFITIGDPTIYSTFFYLYNKLLEQIPHLHLEIIPGVSSINAAASKARVSLGLADEKIAILPATYVDNIKPILKEFDTVVLMKIHKVFDKILRILEEMHLVENAVYVCRAGMDGEVIIRDIAAINKNQLNYFSLLIIRR